MSFCRKNICKIGVLLLVLAGFGLHLAQPLSARQNSHAFTRWLQSVAKEGQAEKIQQELQQLQSYRGELAPLIHKASEIVHRNNDKFRLPVKESQQSPSDVYRLLLEKWSLFKTGESMQPLALPASDSKSLSTQARAFPPSIAHAYASREKHGNLISFQSASIRSALPNPSRVDAIPLIGGSAIGAP